MPEQVTLRLTGEAMREHRTQADEASEQLFYLCLRSIRFINLMSLDKNASLDDVAISFPKLTKEFGAPRVELLHQFAMVFFQLAVTIMAKVVVDLYADHYSLDDLTEDDMLLLATFFCFSNDSLVVAQRQELLMYLQTELIDYLNFRYRSEVSPLSGLRRTDIQNEYELLRQKYPALEMPQWRNDE